MKYSVVMPIVSYLALAGLVPATGAAAVPNPNGTLPTKLANLAVIAVSATHMRTSGQYTTLAGNPIAGMEVKVWSVSNTNFTNWATTYTDANGNFSVQTLKVPVGNRVEIEVQGNGAFSRPYPVFARP